MSREIVYGPMTNYLYDVMISEEVVCEDDDPRYEHLYHYLRPSTGFPLWLSGRVLELNAKCEENA